MNFKEILVEQRNGITVIRFNRPEVRNCIGPVTHRELIQAWAQFRDDPAVPS